MWIVYSWCEIKKKKTLNHTENTEVQEFENFRKYSQIQLNLYNHSTKIRKSEIKVWNDGLKTLKDKSLTL